MRGLANRSEGLGAGLAWALSIEVRGWAGRAWLIEVRGLRAGPAQHGQGSDGNPSEPNMAREDGTRLDGSLDCPVLVYD